MLTHINSRNSNLIAGCSLDKQRMDSQDWNTVDMRWYG